jgi:hypothetical protein
MDIASYLKRLFLISALAAAIVASSMGSSSAFLDKTRFVAHLGVAYFCFHQWVWKPYKNGSFAQGAPHRVGTIVKGGIALLFAVHEVKVAKKIADKSNDPLLKKLDSSLADMSGTFSTIGQKLKSGTFDPKDVEGLGSLASIVSTQAAANGINIKDIPAKIPGL